MPGYGIVDAKNGRGLLPWTWAEKRLSRAHNYWVATARPDGRPHAMAVWGVWLNSSFYFSTGTRSRKARNLVRNPRCVICTDRADEAVIVEGVARKARVSSLPRQVAEAYSRKYKWELDPSQGPIFMVRPRVVFGFIEAADQFPGTATRWTFPRR
jgi:hypothetical protein